ncbi:hypothetical protein Dimus_027007, partial [Dionaea muscipula]
MTDVFCDDAHRNPEGTYGEDDVSYGKPFVGKYFDTVKDVREFYKQYGIQLGFTIRTRSTSKSIHRSEEVTGVTFVCLREGKHPKMTQPLEYCVGEESFIDNTSGEKSATSKRHASTVKCDCK